MRQGESLSPFLFALYLNDLETEFVNYGVKGITVGRLKLSLLLYADDAILFSDNEKDMQLSINALNQYCKRWKLIVNIDKTKLMIFSKRGNIQRNRNVYYAESKLEIVSYFTYLSIRFSSTGSFSVAQKTLAEQGSKAMFSLQKNLTRFSGIRPTLAMDIFDKVIVPVVSYGSKVWGFHPAIAIEVLQKDIMREKKHTQ